jgi:uncharacterized membrane protein YhaH (DUF805 family)
MLDRFHSYFTFKGRLSRVAYLRRQRWSMLLGSIGVVATISLLVAHVQIPLALTPALLLLPAMLVAEVGGYVRRLHDVGRHAHRVLMKDVALVSLIVAPAVIAAMASALLRAEVLLALLSLTGVGVFVGFATQLRHPVRRPGDTGANAFGPPPVP